MTPPAIGRDASAEQRTDSAVRIRFRFESAGRLRDPVTRTVSQKIAY